MEEQNKAEGLKVIWMGFQDRKEKIRQFMEKHDVQASVGYDERDRVSRKYGVRYGAGLIMIDREGTVKKRVPKGFSEKTLLEALPVILAKGPLQRPGAGK